ncbi:histidine phosphatase superfamily [Obelidium mucronatum]|nr:histidine phosphatase superfamily [Obelidium mucronatum]
MTPPQPPQQLTQVPQPVPMEPHIASHNCLRVTVVRHAETKLNQKGPGGRFMQGQLDEGLTEKGLIEAKALAYRLRKQKFNQIFTSDLKRSVQTTNEIEKYQIGVKVTTDIRLREQDLADLAGKKVPEVQSVLKANDKHMDEYLKSKGEPSAVFKARVLEFYNDLVIENLVEPHYDFLDSLAEQEAKRDMELSARMKNQQPPSTEKSAKNPEQDASLTENPTPPTPGPLNKSQSAPAHSINSSPLVPPLVTGNLSFSNCLASPHSPSYHLPHPLLVPTSPIRSTTTASPPPQNLRQRRPQFPQQHILLVTHGGVIKALFKHLTAELGFHVKQLHVGFPKPVSVYEFVISKQFWKDGDYEWSGEVVQMNNVSHLAMMVEKHGEEKDRLMMRARRGKGPPRTTNDGKALPNLPEKTDAYLKDVTSASCPTPQVSPEKSGPPKVKRSLGW